MEKNSADVVIIGAGLAGLTASYELARNGKDVLVLEKEGTDEGLVDFTTG